jgi:hypothetical protein
MDANELKANTPAREILRELSHVCLTYLLLPYSLTELRTGNEPTNTPVTDNMNYSSELQFIFTMLVAMSVRTPPVVVTASARKSCH